MGNLLGGKWGCLILVREGDEGCRVGWGWSGDLNECLGGWTRRIKT